MLPAVYARCDEEKPPCDFVSKTKSARATKNCLECRNKNNSHVSSVFLLRSISTNKVQYSRPRGAILTLRGLAVRPSSCEAPGQKRTDGDAELSPAKDRSGTRPTSPDRPQQPPVARSLFGENSSQPCVVIGTPLPATQQSSRLFRTLAPSPAPQPTTDPVASHFDPSIARGGATRMNYSYLTARFHRGGKVSQDDPSTTGARARLAAIQRDHRSRRRAGEIVSLTPTISQLGVFQGSKATEESIHPFAVICSSFYGLTRAHRCDSESRSTTDR